MEKQVGRMGSFDPNGEEGRAKNAQALLLGASLVGQWEDKAFPPLLIMGPAAGGKSAQVDSVIRAIVRELFERKNPASEDLADLESGTDSLVKTLSASQCSAFRVEGVPAVTDGKDSFRMIPEEQFSALAERDLRFTEAGVGGALILDEFPDAPTDLQAAFHNILLGKKIGELQLPLPGEGQPGTAVFATGNDQSVSTTGGSLSVPVVTRLMQVPNQTSYNDWSEWLGSYVTGLESGSEDYPTPRLYIPPENWKEELGTQGRLIATFTSRMGRECMGEVNPRAVLGDMLLGASAPLATPRTWTMAIHALAAISSFPRCAAVKEARRLALSGLVGETIASNFFDWESKLDLPSPEDCLSGAAPIPTRPDQIMVTCSAVRSYVLRHKGEAGYDKLWSAAWEWGQKASRDRGAEDLVVTTLCMGLIKNRPRSIDARQLASFTKLMDYVGMKNPMKS